MVDYELSPVLKDFTAQTKRVMSNKDTRFKNLFRAMQHVREIKLMKSLISYLISRTYKASNSELVGIFAAQ